MIRVDVFEALGRAGKGFAELLARETGVAWIERMHTCCDTLFDQGCQRVRHCCCDG